MGTIDREVDMDELLEAFEERGTWDSEGRAWLDGRRVPEFDLTEEI